MANWNSNEYAGILNPTMQGEQLEPNQYRGRMRVSTFTFVIPVGFAQNDTVNLCLIPQFARILRGYLQTNGLGASVTAAIADNQASPLTYLGAVTVASAGETVFANTIALNSMAIPNVVGTSVPATTQDALLVLTLGGAAATAGQTLQGWVEWVVD